LSPDPFRAKALGARGRCIRLVTERRELAVLRDNGRAYARQLNVTLTKSGITRDRRRARKREQSKIEATSLTDASAQLELDLGGTIATRATLWIITDGEEPSGMVEDRYNRKNASVARFVRHRAGFSAHPSAFDLQLFWRRHRHAV